MTFATPAALLVIDVQASFTRRLCFNATGLAEYLTAQKALIAGAQQRDWPIVRLLHISPEGDADGSFAIAPGFVRPLDGLMDFDAAPTAHKTRRSALVARALTCG